VCNKGITQFYLPPTHVPHPPVTLTLTLIQSESVWPLLSVKTAVAAPFQVTLDCDSPYRLTKK